MLDEHLTTPDMMKWAPLADGIDFTLLYSSAETGRWTVLFRAQPGSFFDVIHEHTSFPEYTELLFTNYGPVAFLDEKGEVESILDHKLLENLMATA